MTQNKNHQKELRHRKIVAEAKKSLSSRLPLLSVATGSDLGSVSSMEAYDNVRLFDAKSCISDVVGEFYYSAVIKSSKIE